MNLTILIEPAEDIPNCWTAHVLEIDVCSFGESIEHALQMGIEAAELALEGEEAGSFQRAPEEFFERAKSESALVYRVQIP